MSMEIYYDYMLQLVYVDHWTTINFQINLLNLQ